MISRFENNLLGSREVKGLYSEESGGKELDGKGSSLELRPRERGGSKDQSDSYIIPLFPLTPLRENCL